MVRWTYDDHWHEISYSLRGFATARTGNALRMGVHQMHEESVWVPWIQGAQFSPRLDLADACNALLVAVTRRISRGNLLCCLHEDCRDAYRRHLHKLPQRCAWDSLDEVRTEIEQEASIKLWRP